MAAFLDPAMVGVGCQMFRIGEELGDVLKKNRSIGLEREQIVAAT
jgi:hypothetical protein